MIRMWKLVFKKVYCTVFIFIVLTAILASCSSAKKEVAKFAADFATKVSKNQKNSLLDVWPDVAKADSLALSFNVDSIDVEPTQNEGQFKVNFGNADMIVTVAENGKMTVGESNGLFAWPEDKVSMALATGWIKKDLNDMQKQERFADSLFINHLADKLMDGLKTKLKASCMTSSINNQEGTATYTITVKNDNDFDIPADAYCFALTEMGFNFDTMNDVPVRTNTLGGVKVQAKGIAKCPVPGTYDYEYSSLRVSVKIEYNNEQAIKNLLKPTGNEYEEYLKTKH